MINNDKKETDIIEKLLPNVNPGTPLFHYTSAEGLLGMLNSRKIHCSNIFFMNDYEENLNIWKFFFKGLEEFATRSNVRQDYINIINSQLKHWKIFDSERISIDTFKNIDIASHCLFSFSLSRIGDDLSQWRAYTDNSFGFNMSFSINDTFYTLQSFFKCQNFSPKPNCAILFKSCIYKDDEKLKIIIELLEDTYNRFESNERGWELSLFFHILTLNIFFKNEKFENENECRLAILPIDLYRVKKDNKDLKNLKFKRGKSFIIPYIELDITTNLISGITVGPAPFQDHSIASISMMLKSYKKYIGNVPLKQSKIPYRYW